MLFTIPFQVVFLEFSERFWLFDCWRSSINIYDGGTKSSPLLVKACAGIPPAMVQSSSNTVLVHFVSNGYNIGRGAHFTWTGALSIPNSEL